MATRIINGVVPCKVGALQKLSAIRANRETEKLPKNSRGELAKKNCVCSQDKNKTGLGFLYSELISAHQYFKEDFLK
jgi:hypothetical protein